MDKRSPLVFAHIGDLHITKALQQNYIDLLSIVAQIEIECGRQLDFVFLPGDNADNGLPQQYQLVSTALKMLSVPVHIIPGDHDMEQGNLNAFYTMPLAEPLPKSVSLKGYRCLFLDVSGPGTGGPDFRLKPDQLFWLENELTKAKGNQEKALIFTHTYPADLKNEQEVSTLNKLIADHEVLLVDMGHTHYNELTNNGQTVFSATRSTGQIEEGPVGYSITTVDQGVVSWRFKPLADAFPFVMITSPADYRLKLDYNEPVSRTAAIHAVTFGSREITQVRCKIQNNEWLAMRQNTNENYWFAEVEIPSAENIYLTVEVVDESGRPGKHSIQIASVLQKNIIRKKDGSDADSIGAWPENSIFGTQLGPNRNGKPS